MSNRTYTIVLGIALAALAGVLVASYFLHRLTLSPPAVILLLLLIGIPAISAVRLLPWAIIARMSPMFPDMMRERRERDPAPAYAVRACWISFAASFVIMIAGSFLLRKDYDPNMAVFVVLWLALFFLGWLGLILTSRWVQTHGIAIAFAALPVIGFAAAMLFGLGPFEGLLSQLGLVPLGLVLYGAFMILTPINVGFFRLMGLID